MRIILIIGKKILLLLLLPFYLFYPDSIRGCSTGQTRTNNSLSQTLEHLVHKYVSLCLVKKKQVLILTHVESSEEGRKEVLYFILHIPDYYGLDQFSRIIMRKATMPKNLPKQTPRFHPQNLQDSNICGLHARR